MPASEAELCIAEAQSGYHLPKEIRRVLTLTNRPEGFVGESYIASFNANDLIQSWRDAQHSRLDWSPSPASVEVNSWVSILEWNSQKRPSF